MVNDALPSVKDRRAVAYPNVSDKGTKASIIFISSLSEVSLICPRLDDKSEITCQKKSGGTITSIFIIGSRIAGFADFAAF